MLLGPETLGSTSRQQQQHPQAECPFPPTERTPQLTCWPVPPTPALSFYPAAAAAAAAAAAVWQNYSSSRAADLNLGPQQLPPSLAASSIPAWLPPSLYQQQQQQQQLAAAAAAATSRLMSLHMEMTAGSQYVSPVAVRY